MTEQQIQSKKIKELEDEGYYVIKLIKTNKNGIPDVLALHKNLGVKFLEIKTPKGKVSKLQEYRRAKRIWVHHRDFQGMSITTKWRKHF